NVLYPMGFDAFGLPSENYAIKTGIHPAVTTEKNIKTFTKQLKSLGFSFDWNRAVTTTDPKYYKWTQWIFLKMYENGLAYKDKISINWCLSCKIGLANEEVVNGKCERCGGKVEKRDKEQWMLKITDYADRLIEDLETVDYLNRIKTQQINWIGRSEGAEVDFKIYKSEEIIKVYTTRPDTLFGATFMVFSPEHELVDQLKDKITNWDKVEKYINEAKKKSDLERTELSKEKTGVELKGVTAINPVNKRKIPIWIADYVLVSYGTGAIMAVPGHDQRDWDFAKKYKLPIVEVIKGGDVKKSAYEDIEDGTMVNSGHFCNLTVKKCIFEITRWLEEEGLGSTAVNYKLRDWVFSRQRYWGEPIPMINCEKCGWVSVSEKELPIELPKIDKYEPTDTGESPLSKITDWVNTQCPNCGGSAKRETDTMPNWAGSNWYFLRYIDPKNNKELADRKKLEYFAPVDWYNGGMEHTTLHLLYSRFVYKFLYDIGVVPESCGPEPYKKRTSHGLVLGEGGEKMSKSKGNVVNPDEVIKEFGADTFRMYEMFMGPLEMAKPWDIHGIEGIYRFLKRIWRWGIQCADKIKDNSIKASLDDKELTILRHQTIKKLTSDIEELKFNTAISALMIYFNKFSEKDFSKKDFEIFLTITHPLAPHITDDLWAKAGKTDNLINRAWPKADERIISERELEIPVQINGKIKAKIHVKETIEKEELEELAKQSVKEHLSGKKIIKLIIVPKRLVSIVIKTCAKT
ncbi:MAG: leucine--tRNA ligase, partial [Elusimicrobiales bacterium]|nr:leucine--tRNA ligase [Elusimicrobiales bacterium]